MPKENELTNITTLNDSDEIRVLQTGSNSRNITYGNFKTEIGIAGKLNISDIDDTPADDADVPVSSQFNYKQTAQGDYAIGGADPWEIFLSDALNRQQTSASNGTWYNLNSSHQVSLTEGTWDVSYSVCLQAFGGSGSAITSIRSTLSTTNNSETDSDLTYFNSIQDTTSEKIAMIFTCEKRKRITVASNTTYYLNVLADNFSGSVTIRTLGLNSATKIEARRVY